MLDISVLERSVTSPPAEPVRLHRSARYRTKVSGQTLAKRDWDPCKLKILAARWVLGSLTIDPPTIVLATKVFGISEAPIRQAINELRATTVAEPVINSVWREMNDQACEEFVRENLAVLWGYIDHITA